METTMGEQIFLAVNNLNKLLAVTEDPIERKKIARSKDAYILLLRDVINQDLDNEAELFHKAISGLKEATAIAKEAKDDISKIATAINKAADAAKVVDQLVKVGIDLVF